MKNKKRLLIILSIVLVLLLAFLCGTTFSKYVSEVKGQGPADIANWVFKVNGNEQNLQTINLFSTYNAETLINNKIAPGTKGQFNIIVDATGSEVGVDYKVKFLNETQRPQNLKYTYNNNTYNSITELEKDLTGTIAANEENKLKTITIGWEWLYETGSNESEITQNDKIDTQNAKDIQQYTFDVNVIGTQVMPQK